MKCRTHIVVLALLQCVSLALISSAFAEPLASSSRHALAPLAPQGRWVVQLESRSNTYDQWYDNSGNLHELGSELNAVSLDNAIFPALTLFGPGASLGTTSFSASTRLKRAQLTLGYGITKDLTVGIISNYGETKTDTRFSVRNGNIGFNPLFNPAIAIGPANFPFAPVGAGALAPMTASDINVILTNPAFGYAYEPIASTKTRGFGEFIMGVLWRFYSGSYGTLVAGSGLRMSLANNDNPDNLFDIPLDDGSNDALLQLEYFNDFGDLLDVRVMTKRTIQFKDHVTKRVPAPGQLLATAASKENLTRNLGDFWEYDVELGVHTGNWRVAGTWHRYIKSRDSFVSARGQNTAALSAFTDIKADQWRASVSWSGIEAWQQKVIPLPIIAKLEYQKTYKGRNMPKVTDIYLLLTTFF